MRPDARAGGAVPALSGPEIISLTPGLDAIAEIEPVDWGLIPASRLSFAQIIDLAQAVQGALDRPEIDGAIVVQGTDTLEEVAFALDLMLSGDKPVAVTGAMRHSAQDDYDGPENLRAAVRCAAATELAGEGVVLAMDGLVLPADDAVKSHTDSLGSFRAPNLGPLGTVDDRGLIVLRARSPRRSLGSIPESAGEPVHLITVTVAMDGTLVRLAREAGAAGLVIAATGAGNTDPRILDECVSAMAAGVPVVLTTRCFSGQARPAYGFPGGGADWVRAGAMLSGLLGGPKARVSLALGLGAGLREDALASLLAG